MIDVQAVPAAIAAVDGAETLIIDPVPPTRPAQRHAEPTARRGGTYLGATTVRLRRGHDRRLGTFPRVHRGGICPRADHAIRRSDPGASGATCASPTATRVCSQASTRALSSGDSRTRKRRLARSQVATRAPASGRLVCSRGWRLACSGGDSCALGWRLAHLQAATRAPPRGDSRTFRRRLAHPHVATRACSQAATRVLRWRRAHPQAVTRVLSGGDSGATTGDSRTATCAPDGDRAPQGRATCAPSKGDSRALGGRLARSRTATRVLSGRGSRTSRRRLALERDEEDRPARRELEGLTAAERLG
jgi:hypothetical protein